MKRVPANCTGNRLIIPTQFQRSALLCAVGMATILPSSTEAETYDPMPPASISADNATILASDLLLKMIIETMLQLLEEIENIQDAQGILSSDGSLEESAGALVWGYETFGVDDNLSISEIFSGLDDGELAIDILQDETQVLSLPQPIRDLLHSVLEDMTDDLETQI